ncbi:MAG TPA: acyl-CoA dehydrogenase family protein [Gemmatimonadaceae bacterium]|nr:acyl-CoA dehydrogenase family protein [Gemmatimonadaceae bacterium]
MSTRTSHLDWPFFTAEHRTLAGEVSRWVATQQVDHHDADAACRSWVKLLGAQGFLRYCVPASHGGALPNIDSRALCLLREHLSAHDALADFAFAMQGLGSGAISLAGSEAMKATWLPRVARGQAIAAFALSEPDAGSDVGAIATTATPTKNGWRLDGSKTWISNGGIADFYCVFARSKAESSGAKGITAFLVPADAKGLRIAERIETVSPHPLATLEFDGCEIPDANRIGTEGEGFKLAMRTLDIFRVSVAAAAVGFARRALQETIARANDRAMFGSTLAAQPLAQAIVGDMATDLDAATLLTYRAAWQRDSSDARTTAVAAMAKLSATEHAQTIIDRAVQLHGGLGVKSGHIVERLYRDIRALRIYEGATEVQRLIIGRETLGAARAAETPDAKSKPTSSSAT